MSGDEHHFSLIGKMAAIASSLEHYLLYIFGILLGGPDHTDASVIFSYLESFDRRVSLVDALMQRRYKNSQTTLSRWKELESRIRQSQRDRNHVLHGVNLTDWQGNTAIASPTFHQIVKLSGLRGKHAKDREMTTIELDACVQSGYALLADIHRFVLHLCGQEQLVDRT